MNGYFENDSLYLNLEIEGVFPQAKKIIKAQIDTGYSGHLTLPFSDAFPLGLVMVGTTAYTIADGSTKNNLVCLGSVTLEGKTITIPVDVQGAGGILLGTKLLEKLGCSLRVDFVQKNVELSQMNQKASPQKSSKTKVTTN